MDSSKIYDILIKFISNEQRGILIDGSWGIGKTYQINRVLEKIESENKNRRKSDEKVKIIYSSLFGLESIVDLHTELYAKLHPKINAIRYAAASISPAFSLIPYAGDTISNSVSYAIGKVNDSVDKPKNKIKRKKINKRIIIFLDDIERVKGGFDYSSLLGYINQLFLSGLKVVCVCDSSKIEDDKFNELKEKVFDRYYRVTKANCDVIKMYFAEDSSLIDSDIVSLFKDNLRTASKTAIFYREIKQYINSLDAKKYNSIDERILLWYVSLIVSEINNAKIPNDYKRKENDFDYTYDYFFECFEDEKISDSLNIILKKDRGSKHIVKAFENGALDKKQLTTSITYAYLYDEYKFIDEMLLKIDGEKEEVHLFYLSSKERVKAIGEIIQQSKSKTTPLSEREFNRILSMYDFPEMENINYDKDGFIAALANRMIGASNRVIDTFFFIETYPPLTKNILIELRKEYYNILKNKGIKRLKEAFEQNDLRKITEILNIINQNEYFHDKNQGYDLIIEIKKLFKQNDFFIPKLSGTINENKWRLAHEICAFIYNYDFRDDLEIYLKDRAKNSTDSDEKNRLDVLLKKYFSN